MIRLLRLLPLVMSFAGCIFWSVPSGGVGAPAPTPECPTSKIAFTQAAGCLNDGSVEFCIPADDPAALASVRSVAPGVTCARAGGRAGCNLDTEVLCFLDTAGLCTADHNALTDEGWQTVCALAALPIVREIVPTWYE